MKTGKELPNIKERGFIKTTDHRPPTNRPSDHLPLTHRPLIPTYSPTGYHQFT